MQYLARTLYLRSQISHGCVLGSCLFHHMFQLRNQARVLLSQLLRHRIGSGQFWQRLEQISKSRVDGFLLCCQHLGPLFAEGGPQNGHWESQTYQPCQNGDCAHYLALPSVGRHVAVSHSGERCQRPPEALWDALEGRREQLLVSGVRVGSVILFFVLIPLTPLYVVDGRGADDCHHCQHQHQQVQPIHRLAQRRCHQPHPLRPAA